MGFDRSSKASRALSPVMNPVVARDSFLRAPNRLARSVSEKNGRGANLSYRDEDQRVSFVPRKSELNRRHFGRRIRAGRASGPLVTQSKHLRWSDSSRAPTLACPGRSARPIRRCMALRHRPAGCFACLPYVPRSPSPCPVTVRRCMGNSYPFVDALYAKCGEIFARRRRAARRHGRQMALFGAPRWSIV